MLIQGQPGLGVFICRGAKGLRVRHGPLSALDGSGHGGVSLWGLRRVGLLLRCDMGLVEPLAGQ